MITDQELDELEKSRQKDSDWLLLKVGLIPKLEKYGTVKIAGAKALGLMLAKDIDISVVVDKVRIKDWQELTEELMITPDVRNISAIDYYNYDDQNRYNPTSGQKYSLYLSINNLLGPENDKYDTWECQIHLIEPKMFDEAKITGVLKKLTPKTRLLILRIKHWASFVNRILKLATNGNYKIPSPSIYEAVLEKNVDSITKFIENFKFSVPEKFQQDFESAIKQVSTKN